MIEKLRLWWCRTFHKKHLRYGHLTGEDGSTEQIYCEKCDRDYYEYTEYQPSRFKMLGKEEYIDEDGTYHCVVRFLGRIQSDNKQWMDWLIAEGYTDKDGYGEKPLDDAAFARLKEFKQ